MAKQLQKHLIKIAVGAIVLVIGGAIVNKYFSPSPVKESEVKVANISADQSTQVNNNGDNVAINLSKESETNVTQGNDNSTHVSGNGQINANIYAPGATITETNRRAQ